MRRRGLLVAALLAGCGAAPGDSRPGTPTGFGQSTATDGAGAERTPVVPPGDARLGFTHLRPTGNRLVDGTGRIPDVDPTDVALDGTPRWVVGVPDGDATLWAVAFDDGRVRGLRAAGGDVEPVGVTPASHPGPPLLALDGDPRLVTAPGGSPTTHPLPVGDSLAVVRPDGRLALRGGTTATLAVGALPDARVVRDGHRLFVLAAATGEYGHGVLGDGIEAGGVAVVDAQSGEHRRTLAPPAGTVIEGLAPLLADLDGDGRREVLVTASDSEAGARLVALSPDGGVAARGRPVGSGFRWRHQLAVAPFGPGGRLEVAAVKTPHIGGTAEFYRAAGDRLELVAARAGYSSHRIGSRNLDGAAAGRFDGDRVQLLVPDDPREALAGLERTADGVREAWRVPVGGGLATNVAAVAREGRISVAAGRPGHLRLWR